MNHVKSNMERPSVDAEKLPKTPQQFAEAGYWARLELKRKNPKIYDLFVRGYR